MEINTEILKGFIGTYTKGDSKGIYNFSFNANLGEVNNINVAGELGNPTYIAISSNKKYLYSVMKDGDMGGVAAYLINKEDLSLSLLNYKLFPGSSPCHLITNKDDSYLFSANYHTGEINCYPLNEDGSLCDPSSRVFHEGTGPNKDRQEKAHAHFVGLTPNEEKLLAIDLGIDKMVVYDYKDGNLVEDSSLTVKFEGGSGPRHMTFHPNKNFAFLLSELTSEVFVLKYNPSNNVFEIIQKISALPENFKGKSKASAIHISSDGRFLYTSNRGYDSIAVFAVDSETSLLSLVEITETKGKYPRDFVIDPTGNYVIVPHEGSDNMTIFSRDKNTGKMTKLDQEYTVPSGVCIKFL